MFVLVISLNSIKHVCTFHFESTVTPIRYRDNCGLSLSPIDKLNCIPYRIHPNTISLHPNIHRLEVSVRTPSWYKSVAIVQLGLYTILRILLLGRGLYIVYEIGRRRWFGLLSNLVCRRRRLPPLLVVASCGGREILGVTHVFLKKQDVFICDKAALL